MTVQGAATMRLTIATTASVVICMVDEYMTFIPKLPVLCTLTDFVGLFRRIEIMPVRFDF